MTKTTLSLSLLVLTALACQQPASDETATPAPEPAATSAPNAATETEPAVEYEPAYPTDVSNEELSESDIAQQETPSHGEGDEHSHGEGGHEHGAEEAHDDHQH